MKNKRQFKLSGQQGFSLVELLVVIAVIAVIAAIAIPNIAGITGQAKIAKDQRNAQNIASVAAAAKAAGVDGDLSTPDAAVSALQTGVSGTLNGQVLTFSVSTMSTEEQSGAKTYLQTGANTNSGVMYNPVLTSGT